MRAGMLLFGGADSQGTPIPWLVNIIEPFFSVLLGSLLLLIFLIRCINIFPTLLPNDLLFWFGAQEVITIWSLSSFWISIKKLSFSPSRIGHIGWGRSDFWCILRCYELLEWFLDLKYFLAWWPLQATIIGFWPLLLCGLLSNFVTFASVGGQPRFDPNLELLIINLCVAVHIKSPQNCDKFSLRRKILKFPQKSFQIRPVQPPITPVINLLESTLHREIIRVF